MANSEIVTVVTATYNRFDHLADTIKSVLIQDYPNIEYIIADDGSAEFPIDIITELTNAAPSNIVFRLIRNKENVGTVKNLNNAYTTALGSYYINLSCGDVFFDESVVSNIYQRFKDNDSDVIVTSRILYNTNLNPVCFFPHFDERNIIISRFRTGFEQYTALITGQFYDMASGSAMSYSRRIMEQMGFFDEKYRLWEDGPFLAKYLQKGCLDYAYDIVSIWYETGGVSSKKNVKDRRKKTALDIDTELFNYGERLEHINELSLFQKRKVQFRNAQFKHRGSILRHLIGVVFPLEYIGFLLYSLRRNNRSKKDLIEIRNLISNQKKG